MPHIHQPTLIRRNGESGSTGGLETIQHSNSTVPSSSHPSYGSIHNTTTQGNIVAESANKDFRRRDKRPRDPSPSAPSPSGPASYSPSSSKVSVSTSLDSIRAFFNFKGPELKRATRHTDSTSTRTPGDFDTHLLQEYRLMHVVKLKEIPDEFASVAQAALDEYSGDLPADSDAFASPNRLADWIHPYKDKIERESDVERLYGMTVARGCLPVAGTLAYGHRSWSAGCLQWSFRPPSTKKEGSAAKNQGVADGFLNIFEEKGSSLTPDQQLVFDCFPVLAVWEFKNLNFCTKEAGISTMKGAVNGFLQGTFPWATCEFGPWQCLGEHPRDADTWSPMGWDAKNPPCASYRQARDSLERNALLKERILEANQAKKKETNTETEESDDEVDPEVHSTSASIPQSPSKQTRPLKQVSRFKVASRDLLQQAWTEAVRHDATFIIIHTGNTEIFGIRDRLTQTLYISDILEIQDCQYYMQIHTGLMIAAVRDAEDRARLLQYRSTPKTWNPTRDSDKALDLKHKSIEEARKILLEQVQRRPWLKIQPAERLRHFPFTKDLYHRQTKDLSTSRESSLEPSSRFESQVSVSSQEGSLALESSLSLSPSQASQSSLSEVPIWTFLENETPRARHYALMDHDIEKTPLDLDAIFQLYVKHEPFYGTRICRGTLKIHGTLFPANFRGTQHPILVIKNASEIQEIEMLKDEHDVLSKLHEGGGVEGIPQVYGFFYNQSEREESQSFAALVMEDKGSTLGKFLEEVKIREEKRRKTGKRRKQNVLGYVMSDAQKAGFKEVLRKVHDAGYAHGNLSPKSLAFKNKAVSIIGYGKAVPLPLELSARVEVISKEHERLDELLETLVPSHYLL